MSLAIAAAFVAVGLAGPADGVRNVTIADYVSRSGGTFDHNSQDFDILLTAVKAANLVGPLSDPKANLTLFAPNDAAFVRLARDLGFKGHTESGAWEFLVQALTSLGGGDPIPVLTQVLLYHVSGSELRLRDVIRLGLNGKSVSTLQGGTFTWKFGFLVDADPDLRNPTFTGRVNVDVSNGIIHTIDRVLIPINLP